MNIEWKYKEKIIGKSGDLLLARRSVDATPSGGKSLENRLYINNNNNIIEGKTAYETDYSGNYYIVTEVRKNINQTY